MKLYALGNSPEIMMIKNLICVRSEIRFKLHRQKKIKKICTLQKSLEIKQKKNLIFVVSNIRFKFVKKIKRKANLSLVRDSLEKA